MGALRLIKGGMDPTAAPDLKSIHIHPPEAITAKDRKRFGVPPGFEFVMIVGTPNRRWGRWVNPVAVKP